MSQAAHSPSTAAEKPQGNVAAARKPAKPAAKVLPAKHAPTKTGVMAAAEEIAEAAKKIALEAEKLTGPLRRTKEAKENEIEQAEAEIKRQQNRIQRLRTQIATLTTQIEEGEAPAIASLRKIMPES